MHTSPISLGGLPIDRVTQAGALDAIARLVRDGRGGFVVTPNLDHVAIARSHEALKSAYAHASLSLADGRPLLWLARLAGTPLPAQVTGSDLLEPLLARAEAERWRVFLLGAREDVSRLAQVRMRRSHPRLILAGADTSRWHPGADQSPLHAPTVRAVLEARADLVLVMYGCPKQELWMQRYVPLLGGAVAVGLGGSLDFYAGVVRRAPRWMSRIGLEWAYRLAQEPRRLAGRYLWRDPLVIPPLLLEALGRRLVRRAGGVSFRDTRRPGRPGSGPASARIGVRGSA